MLQPRPVQTSRHDHSGSSPGFTIVELLIAMTLLSIIAVTGVQLLGLLLRAEQSASHQSILRLHLPRLAEDFRRDVHRAHSIEAFAKEAPDAGFVLLTPEERIAYTSTNTGLLREVWSLNGNERLSTERYLIPGQLHWQLEEPLVRMALTPAANERGSTLQSEVIGRWQFEAVLHRGPQP